MRYARMQTDPFTFLRGAAAMMAADLASMPATGLRVQSCGDCHLNNFGAYASPEGTPVFDINDFDETLPAPFEYCWSEEGLRISVRVSGLCVLHRALWSAPSNRRGRAAGQHPRLPTPPIPLKLRVTGGTLRLAEREWFPLNTTFEVDPLRAVLGAAGQLGGDEHAAVQILARPATGRRVRTLFPARPAIQERSQSRRPGASPRPAVAAASAHGRGDGRRSRLPRTPASSGKAAAPLYEVLGRYAASSGSTNRRGHRVLRGRAAHDRLFVRRVHRPQPVRAPEAATGGARPR